MNGRQSAILISYHHTLVATREIATDASMSHLPPYRNQSELLISALLEILSQNYTYTSKRDPLDCVPCKLPPQAAITSRHLLESNPAPLLC
jgi:hypothetical protein